MTKKDLKSGMIVILRDGSVGLLVDTREGLLIQYDDYYGVVDDYEDHLKSKLYENSDIMEVKIIAEYKSYIIRECLKKAITIWRRIEEIELTLEEIAEKFNINVEQLKIKK